MDSEEDKDNLLWKINLARSDFENSYYEFNHNLDKTKTILGNIDVFQEKSIKYRNFLKYVAENNPDMENICKRDIGNIIHTLQQN